MYDRTYGKDWEALDKDEAVERAFALGVAAKLDEPDTEEYQRILEVSGTSYDRSLIELAYNEGQRKAQGKRTNFEDRENVWDTLVESDEVEKTTVDKEDIPRQVRDAPPGALRSAGLLEQPLDNDLEKQELPDFLKK